MPRKLALLTLFAAIASFALAPQALAVDLADRRVAPEHEAPQRKHKPHGLFAPLRICPDQFAVNAPVRTQQRAMHCMTDYARRARGLGALYDARQLDRSAHAKAADILHCDSFSHFACGRDFTYWMRRSGYLSARCWRAAENIAWGTGKAGTVRAIFRTWMHSAGHRQNILGRFRQLGVSLRIGGLDGHRNAHVWTQHFGSHCR